MFPRRGTIVESGTSSACRGSRLRSSICPGDTPRQADAVPLSQTRCPVVFHAEDLNVALSSQGQTRHMCLVFLAYTLLMCELRQNRAQEWALQRPTTIGEARRALLRENLCTTLEWAFSQVTEHGQTIDRVMLRLGIA